MPNYLENDRNEIVAFLALGNDCGVLGCLGAPDCRMEMNEPLVPVFFWYQYTFQVVFFTTWFYGFTVDKVLLPLSEFQMSETINGGQLLC